MLLSSTCDWQSGAGQTAVCCEIVHNPTYHGTVHLHSCELLCKQERPYGVECTGKVKEHDPPQCTLAFNELLKEGNGMRVWSFSVFCNSFQSLGAANCNE